MQTSCCRLAASLERGSEHPLAAAICGRTPGEATRADPRRNFESLTGTGFIGMVDGNDVVAWQRGAASGVNIDLPALAEAER